MGLGKHCKARCGLLGFQPSECHNGMTNHLIIVAQKPD